MKLKILLTSLLTLSIGSKTISAQTESTLELKPTLTFTGFSDVFYAYDFNKPESDSRQSFLYNHNRHNEFNLNLGLLKFAANFEKYRANLAFQAGTYVNDNYSAESRALQSISEANIGIALNRKQNLWLDAGIMNSHIGFESAISTDNYTLSRSILAENSPYYETGLKLTYNPNSKWEIAGLVLNGWQCIQRVQGNSLPSFGTQVKFTPNSNTTINWSTFVGSVYPDATRRMRYFNNVYGQFKLSENINLIAGCDVGLQQSYKGSSAMESWIAPVVIAQYVINDYWKSAVRLELYSDENGVMLPEGNLSGFSWNVDYSPNKVVTCRVEARALKSDRYIFLQNNSSAVNDNFTLLASMAIKFGKSWNN